MDEKMDDQMLMTMKRELTSAQKAGYCFVGIFLGVGGVLLASLCNLNAPYRPDCTRFALVGLVIKAVFTVISYFIALPFAFLL